MKKRIRVRKNKFIKRKPRWLTKTKKQILYKILYIFVLLLLLILFQIFYKKTKYYKNFGNNFIIKSDNDSLEEQILKEVEKVEPYYGKVTLDDVKVEFESLINKYKYLLEKETNIADDCPIWMMWYQGIETAPPIVLSCFESIIKNREKHPVIIISKYNIDKYIKLPPHIMERLNNKTFGITHFSDVVRMTLLFKYGGYWIDATYFVRTPLSHVNTSFYTLKLDECFTYTHPFVKCIWSVNFLAVTKNSFLATYCYHAFMQYWKKYNSLLDYFLIDYMIHVAYYAFPEFKDIFKRIPNVHCNIFTLFRKLNDVYNPSDVCLFNKLGKDGRKRSFGDRKTNFDYIIENYQFDFNNTNNYILNI